MTKVQVYCSSDGCHVTCDFKGYLSVRDKGMFRWRCDGVLSDGGQDTDTLWEDIIIEKSSLLGIRLLFEVTERL